MRLASTNGMSYEAALREIGPEAVPFIFRKLEADDSPFQNWYRITEPKLPEWLRRKLPGVGPIEFSVRTTESAIRLAVTNDAELIHLMLPATKNHNPAIREAAFSLLIQLGYGLTTNELVTIYRRMVADSDPSVRIRAIVSIRTLGPAASDTVPELTDALQGSETGRHRDSREHVYVRANAAMALGHMRSAAATALPALTNLLMTGDGYQRVAAATAIWQITSNVNGALPHLIADLPSLDVSTLPLAIQTLGDMGPQAKPAVPALLVELGKGQPRQPGSPPSPAGDLNSAIRKALEVIDPTALTQLGTNDEH